LFVAKNRRKSFDFKQIRSKKLVFIRCLIAVLPSCFRLKIRRFVHPKTASLKKNSIKFADSIFLTTFDFRSLICFLSWWATSPLLVCNDLLATYQWDGNPAQKVAKAFSISSSLGLAVLPFSPARGTLCQRGDLHHFWVQRKSIT
jgi:hypothetical protein